MISPADKIPMSKNPVLSWEFVLLKLMLLILVGVMLEKPAGSLAGRIALQQEGFNLYTYDMKANHVYAIAIGPRDGASEERGVWINKDGSFRIDRLPVGEYTLKVHVPGFATSYDSGIFVAEGKVTQLHHDVTLHLAEPSVNMASNTRVFTPSEQPRFWINASGCNRAVVKIYAKNMLSLLKGADKDSFGFAINSDMSIYRPYEQDKKKSAVEYFKALPPVQKWTRPLDSDDDDWAHEEFKCDKPLPPGDYFAVAEVSNPRAKTDWNLLWFSVSDLGLIVKQDPARTVVRAVDLTTLQPRAGADIQIFDRVDNKASMIAHGKTGADGFVSIPLPEAYRHRSSMDLLAYGAQGTEHAYGGVNFYGGESDQYETYFYTDRPIYRLGQTVYYKGIARGRNLEAWSNPGANLKVQVLVEDPDNNQIWEGRFTTSKHGTFHGVFEVPKDGKTGAYQVTVKYPDGTSSYERFEVAEYRKPEYQVDVLPAQPRVAAGTKVKARIRAAYYFGAPVTNAKVKYTVFSSIDWSSRYKLMDRPDYYGYFDGWDHDDEGCYEGSYNGDYVCEGYAQTDENGEATIEFDSRTVQFNAEEPYNYDYYDKSYKIEAEVTDLSRIAVVGSNSVSVTNGDFALFVQPNNYVSKVGEPISVDFNAVSYDNGHQPLQNLPVKLKLFRRKYDRNEYTYKGVQVYEEATVTTDQHGKGHAEFKTKPEFPTDTYYVSAQAEDAEHHTIFDESSIWVVSENYPYMLGGDQAQKEPLTIKLDKGVYKPGETAKVMITAPVTGAEGAQAIVAIEGAKLYSYQVVDMKATARMVEIPVTSNYAPNVYVTVTFIGKKHQFYNQSQMLKVSPESRFLKLAISSDKPKYKPGDKATYTVKAVYADGKPAADTELSLGVVDESIYAIRPDSTPDIRKFFYNKRSNAVTTACSFPEEYSGGPNKIEPRVRKDFRDTAAWLPQLVTNENGVATATIKLPDNLTTWRATARAITVNSEVGSTIQKVVSTQDLILRLALPRFFSQGDEGLITAVVHNYTDKPQGVELTLAASQQFQVLQGLAQKIVVNPDKAERLSWPVRIVQAGEGSVRCKAVGSTAGDAMELKLPIRPLGVPAFLTKSGILTTEDQSVTLPLDYPANAAAGSVKYDLYVSSSALGPLLGNFSSLIDYPYGCTEQTMSKLMPSVVAMRIHQTLGVPLDKKDTDRFQEVYKQSMAKLDEYQHADGGWGWWANDNSNPYLTALVLDGYSLLKDAGYYVDPDRAKKGRAWLKDNSHKLFAALTEPLHKKEPWADAEAVIDMSKAYYVLGVYGDKMPDDVKKWVLAHRSEMTPEPLSYFTLALKRTGDSEAARAMYDRMIELSNQISGDLGSFTDWSPNAAMFKKLNFKDDRTYYYSYRFTDVETTALALESVLSMEPGNIERIESVKRWILLQRGKNGWDNTKTTSQVFRAFMDAEILAKQEGTGTDFQAQASAPGQTPVTLSFGAKSLFDKEKDIAIAVAHKPGQLTLHKTGPGRLYYTAVMTWYKSIKPGEFVAEKSSPEGLKLKREFFRLVPSTPDSNGNVHFTAAPLTDRKVKAGETILMKVYVDSPTSFPYTVLEAPLPSGAEVVENDPREDTSTEGENGANTTDQSPYNWGKWWWTHQDILDDHMAFFVTDFPYGKEEFHTMIRMELPGTFQMNPISLEGMYTKGVRAYSGADQITVTDK